MGWLKYFLPYYLSTPSHADLLFILTLSLCSFTIPVLSKNSVSIFFS